MKMVPPTMRSNPGVKQAYNTYKLRTTPADAASPIYELPVPFFDDRTPEEWIKFQRRLQAVLKGQNVTQGSPSYAVAKTLLKGNTLTVFEQAEIDHGTQSVPHFELCLDDVAEHAFPKKARQTQKHYMRRNLQLVGGMTVKEWVAQVSELNGHLNNFPVTNGNHIQPLDNNKLLDILEYGVPASWHRKFSVQGFDPVDQGLQKFVEF
eukprot:9849337-Ditylum_brightwellii.AAC.1